MTATVHDDDTASVIIDTDPDTAGAQTALELDEGGSATYTIAITSQPRSTVHSYIVDGQLLVDGRRVFTNDPAIPALLNGGSTTYVRFTAENWRTPQQVTVRGRQDGRKDGDRTATVRHSTGAGSYYGKPVADVTLTVKDTDTMQIDGHQAVVLAPGKIKGWWIMAGVASRPRSPVTLTLASSNANVAVVDVDPDTPGDQKTLTLGTRDWFAPRLVAVRGGSVEGTASIRVSGVSGDPGYSGLQGTEVGTARVCAGVSYRGNVGRCPGDQGYQQAQSQGEETFAPAFSAEAEDQAAQVGEPFSYTVPEATDPQGDAIAYAAGLSDDQPLPDWLAFDPATRILSGTPRAVDALAVLEIAVTAAETETQVPLADRTVFTLTVAAADGTVPNRPPAFAEAAEGREAVVGKPFGYTVPGATDPDEGDTLTYTATLSGGSALPGWLRFDAATLTLSGTPGKGDAPADLKIAVTATDDGDPNESATTTFALKVLPAIAACETAVTVGEAPVALTGEPWNAPDCMAHHRTDSPARYFKVALAEETALELELRTREPVALFVSTGRPANGWGTVPKAGMEHRLTVRRANGKLAKEVVPPALPPGVPGANVAALFLVPVTLPAGEHFVEVVLAGEAKEDPPLFDLKIAKKPPELSVADARAKEDAGSISFSVTLDRALATRATVDWATSDGTALAGSDYTAASGSLAFEPGETEKTVSVTILDDAHDEGEETFALTLSNAAGARLGDATATGTIANEDPLQAAWLSRFGRSVASQTVAAVTARLALPPGTDPHVTLGGHRVPVGHAWTAAAGASGDVTLSAEGSRGGTAALKAPGDERTLVAHRWRATRASHPELMATAERRLSGADRAEASYRVPRRGELSDAKAADDGAWVEFERASLRAGGGVSRATLRLTVGGDAWMPEGAPSTAAADPALAEDGEDGPDGRGMTGRELLLASSFLLSPEAAGPGGRWTAWGRAGTERFSGTDGGLSVEGDVTAGVFGFDRESGRWLAGVALTHAVGDGEARGGATGPYGLESDMTAVSPYLRVRLSDRLSAWGLAGAGRGAMEIAMPEGTAQRTDLRMRMAALGGRAELVPERSGGFGVALRGDAFRVRTDSDAVATEGVGNLAAASGVASRMRVAVEAWRTVTFSGGSTLRPTLEAGLRRDGGDAGAGTGIEIGGRLAWSDPATGLTADVAAHRLVARAGRDGDEWGLSVGIRLSPDARGRGPSASLTASRGPSATGADGVWSARGAADLVPGASDDARLDAEFGYGTAVRGTNLTGTPYAGLGTGGDGRKWRLGWRLSRPGEAFSLSVDADRREGADDPVHGIGLKLDMRW